MELKKYNAVVLAGDRGADDPVLKHAKVNSKAELIIGGVMQLERVVMALVNANYIDKIFVVGPNKITANSASDGVLSKYKVTSLPVAEGPSASALSGLNASNDYPTLIITCDLPLITAEDIDAYCQQISGFKADFIVSAVNHQLIADSIPELKKTIYTFSKESICFANIFAVMTQRGLRAVDFWREMEAMRKSPLQIISKLGVANLLSYKLGRLQLMQVANLLSKRVSASVVVENVSCVALAIDVDSVHDYEVMNKYLA